MVLLYLHIARTKLYIYGIIYYNITVAEPDCTAEALKALLAQ